MKFNILPLAIASAGLLASASPMRVVIVSSGVQTLDGPVAQLQPPTIPAEIKQHAPCGAGRLRQKAAGFSKALMSALGFSHADKEVHAWRPLHVEASSRPVNLVQPLPFIGTPNGNGLGLEGKTPGGDRMLIMPMSAHPHPERIHGHGHFHHLKKQGHSFLMRVHYALMSLGPWEGRAVAFVLGCGIGVLLRMVWVLTVISYRLVRGLRLTASPSHDENEYAIVDFGSDAEEIFVAPPHYTYPVDEKVEPLPVPVAVPVPANAEAN